MVMPNPFAKKNEETKTKYQNMDGDDNGTQGNIKKSSDASDISGAISTAGTSVKTDITFTPGEIKVDEIPMGEVPPMGEKEGEGINEELPEDISLEDFQPLLNSFINVPGLYFGTWWVRSREQTDIFAKELHIYCQKKGINIRDYMFDELPLLMVGAQLAGGIYSDYKTEKAKKKKPEDKVDDGRLPGHMEHTEEKTEVER